MSKFIRAAMSGALQFLGRSYFFGPTSYRRYSWSQDILDDGGSLPIFAWHLPSTFQTNLDAALNGAVGFAQYAYFFKGDQYVRYNWNTNRVDYGPASIAQEWNLPSDLAQGLDAALCGVGNYANYAYFFKGNQYAGYNWGSGTVEKVSTLADWNLPPSFQNGIDATVNGALQFAQYAYFFKDKQYVRYNWLTGNVEPPVDIGTSWPALLGLNDPPKRRMMLYVTIDPSNHHPKNQANAGGHNDNFTRLSTVAQAWRGETYVDDFWCPDVTDAMLNDPHMLALFLAGSFTEWVEAFRQQNWQQQLNALCAQIKTTCVPILAVCGSHQLVAYAYGGWGNLSHMPAVGQGSVVITNEANGIFQAPNPRPGEVGVFGFNQQATYPILSAIPDPAYFVEYHHDEVLLKPEEAVSLLSPDGLTGACQKGKYTTNKAMVVDPGKKPPTTADFEHEPLTNGNQRSLVQALKYNVTPSRRILYTTQFHPELSWSDSNCPVSGKASAHGAQFITNFLSLADQYWVTEPDSKVILLLLDRSTSMTEPAGSVGITKIEALREAVLAFVTLVPEGWIDTSGTVHSGNAVGIITFAERAWSDPESGFSTAITYFNNTGDATAELGAFAQALQPVTTLGPCTAIGQALEAANDMLASATDQGADYFGYTPAIVLFTDGMENILPYIKDVPTNYATYAIGLGTGTEVNTDVLTRLSESVGGYCLLTGELTEDTEDYFRLKKYFIQILMDLTDQQVSTDPAGLITAGQLLRIPFTVTEADMNADVVLLTDGPGVEFMLETPNGRILPVGARGVLKKQGHNLQCWRLNFRHMSPTGAAPVGTWYARLRRREVPPHGEPQQVRYSLSVHTRSNLRMQAQLGQPSFVPGTSFQLRVAFTQYGASLTQQEEIGATVQRPNGTAELYMLKKTAPGVFEAEIPTSVPGVYQVHLRATGHTVAGALFQREKLFTAAVWPGGENNPPHEPMP